MIDHLVCLSQRVGKPTCQVAERPVAGEGGYAEDRQRQHEQFVRERQVQDVVVSHRPTPNLGEPVDRRSTRSRARRAGIATYSVFEKNLPSYPEGYSQDILLLLLCIHSFIHLLGSEGPKATYKSQNTIYNNHSVAHVVKSLTKVKRYDNWALHPGVWSEAA